MKQLKIAMISPYDMSYPSGVNSHAVNLCRALEDRGHITTLIAPSTKKPYIANINFISIGKTVPIRLFNTQVRLSLNPFNVFKLRAIFRSENFDIVHIHEPFLPLTSLFSLMFSKSATIGTFHAFNEGRNIYKYIHALLTPFLKLLQNNIAVSNLAKSHLLKHITIDEKKMTVIANGVNLNVVSSVDDQSNCGIFKIAFIGRDEPRKGLLYLLQAFEELRKELRNIKLILIGPTSLKRYATQFSDLLTSDVIEFIPVLSNDNLLLKLSSIDILCLPSIGGESFGITFLEGMASKTPVVATNIAAYQLLVRGYEYPLIPIKNPNAIKNYIKILIKDENYRRQISDLGFKIVQNYGWKEISEKVESIYFDALKNDL